MMKKYMAFIGAMAVAGALAGCGSPDNVSNNLGGATRDNSAYRYNYDFSAGDAGDGWTAGEYGTGNDAGTTRGAAYWDYYGITNGSANDSLTGMYTAPNTASDSTYNNQSVYGRGNTGYGVYGTPSNDAAIAGTVRTTDTANINSASVAN